MQVPLFPYQDSAVDKFLDRGRLLLAFSMGLGKTATSIGAAEELIGAGKIGQVLVICPASLKWQWAASISKFTDVASEEIRVGENYIVVPDESYCVVVDGGPKKRQEAYQKIADNRPQYIVAGYQTIVSDLREFLRLTPGLIIADEVHLIKNPAARVTKCVRRLDAPYKLGMTGTPIDNRFEELFQIFRWIDPDLLGPARAFEKAYIVRDYWGNVRSYRNIHILRKKLAPAMVRLTYDHPDVAPYMPKTEHQTWNVRMDVRTWDVYCRIMRDLRYELDQLPQREKFDLDSYYDGKLNEHTAAGRVMAVHMAAQQLLTHPPLLIDSPSQYAQRLVSSGALDGLGESAKIRKLHDELSRIFSQDPETKVILVTRFRSVLDYLAEAFSDYGVITYHGGMKSAAKQAAVNRFHDDPGIRIFAMSHAGAYGVDIPAANWLINIDPARSAGQRAQINARHVRASSRHERVQVIDLVTSGTIEDRVYRRLDSRGSVARAVVDGSGPDSGEITATEESLTDHIESVLSHA